MPENAPPTTSKPREPRKRCGGLHYAFLCLVTTLGEPAVAQAFIEDTHLLNIFLGSRRSNIADQLAIGGYELADGTPFRFSDWYSSSATDLNVLFLTQVHAELGIVWGVSFGERGAKYTIDPGFWLGFIYRHELGERSSITVSASTLLGGDFRELPCIGNFGAIGGVQPVNCRLAASILPPEETLQLLVREDGYAETQISIQYEYRF